jgi:hypothetical protein
MKYYVRKEIDHNGTFYCAYEKPNYTHYICCDFNLKSLGDSVTKEMASREKAYEPRMISYEVIGEFDTEPDDEEDVCQDCGEPTDDPDYEYCTECLAGRAELAVESRMER